MRPAVSSAAALLFNVFAGRAASRSARCCSQRLMGELPCMCTVPRFPPSRRLLRMFYDHIDVVRVSKTIFEVVEFSKTI